MREENINFVIDSSFILSHLLPDEHVQEVAEIFKNHAEGKITFYAPLILPFEVTNGLRYAAVSKRITKNTAKILVADFINIKIVYEMIDLEGVLALSFAKQYSIYDTSYVWLAKSMRIPLLTLDDKLAEISS